MSIKNIKKCRFDIDYLLKMCYLKKEENKVKIDEKEYKERLIEKKLEEY